MSGFWWWWGGGAPPPDPAQALLDEAAVRFDFSQYTDINDMVDVNSDTGPLTVAITGSPALAFVSDGLAVTATSVSGQAVFLRLTGVTPLLFGPEGMTTLEVMRYTANVHQVAMAQVKMFADFNGAQEPEFITGLSISPSGDEISADLYDAPPDVDTIFDDSWAAATTPDAASGIFMTIGTVDVPAGEARLSEINPVERVDVIVPFDKVPPDFAGSPRAIERVQIKALVSDGVSLLTITRVEWLAWNRALSDGEVDALVAHFQS